MNIWEIKNELGLKKYDNPNSKDGYMYQGVLTSGNLQSIFDYNVGLLTVNIKNPKELKYPIITITTVDDGVWQGYGSKYVDVEQLVKQFKERFGTKLPSEAILNNFLNHYGIFGGFTG